MNLEILHPHAAIPLVLTAMIAVPAAMYAIFKRKHWV